MISVAAARSRLASLDAALVGQERVERVPVGASLGRVLAEPFVASFPQPREDNSAMDGYALRAADAEGATGESPARLRVVGVSAAGRPLAAAVEAGSCAQVMTGALIPEGADAVVIVENTAGFADDVAEIRVSTMPGANIRRRGEELGVGTTLLAAGTNVGPAELGSLVTFGAAEVAVRRRPKVALFSTGDELREPGEELGDGDIYNANLPVLAAIARDLGAEVVHSGVIRDEPASLERFLGEALRSADIICASGGVSMGRFDHVPSALRDLGAEEVLWKVAQKPGKPLFVAKTPSSLFFGLPGNPVSTLTCFIAYVVPRLRALYGLGAPASLRVPLAAPFPRQAAKHRFLFGQLSRDEEGRLVARPASRLGSHMGSAALRANVLLEAEAGPEPLAAGASVEATPLPWASLSSILDTSNADPKEPR